MLFNMGKKLVEGSSILMTDFFFLFPVINLSTYSSNLQILVNTKHSEELWNLLCKDVKGNEKRKKGILSFLTSRLCL